MRRYPAHRLAFASGRLGGISAVAMEVACKSLRTKQEASVSMRGQHRRRDGGCCAVNKVARDVTHAAATAAADSGSPAARCAHGVFLQRAAKDFSSREHAWITPSALQCLSNARTTFFARRGRPQPMAENTRIMRCTIGAGDLAARKATKPGAVAPISR